MSNYQEPDEGWMDGESDDDLGEYVSDEVTCPRCRGTGADRDGADCLNCEGWGSILING